MNIIAIILKEFKQQMRDKKSNVLMIVLPIILIFILSKAFSTAFSNTIVFDDVKVLYTLEADKTLEESFVLFTEDIGNSLKIEFEDISDKEKGINAVKEGNYACYIVLGDKITIYKNERFNFEANLIESICVSFASRYDAINEIAKNNPEAIKTIMSNDNMDYTTLRSLDKMKAPNSIDYYAVTMLTLILLYASLIGYSSVKSEYQFKTQNRIFASAVRKHEYLTGKIIGCLSITVMQSLLVFIFGKYLMHANWGNDILTVFLIIISESILAVSLGVGVAYMSENEATGTAILNILVPLIAFLGGGYVPIENFGNTFQQIAKVSPLKWTNEAIFRLIYDNSYMHAFIAILINLTIATLFISFAAFKTGKELKT